MELALKEHADVFDLDIREVTDAVASWGQQAAFTIGVRCESLSIGC
ncbi:hypothetical protein NEH83_33335 [Streptomyces sp. JUS-F4]|nr:hypothetical protein [Streptomyces sp. JUS-F4]WKN18647.1 hypothetical protein NEH83_33335 [Streptomyces sp. JUS-F4]